MRERGKENQTFKEVVVLRHRGADDLRRVGGGGGGCQLHERRPVGSGVPAPCSRNDAFANDSVIFSLEILDLYWDSLLVRGGFNFSLRINWKRIICNV